MDQTKTITASPLETLTTDETNNGVFGIDSISPSVRSLISSYEAPEYISGPLSHKYSLEPEQEYAVARFLMEVVLGQVTEADTAAHLSEITDLDIPIAQAMISTIEEDLLAPNGLSFSSLIHGNSEPVLVADRKGKEGLRYNRLDDLLADLEPLEPNQRVAFLQDAKKFNRIFVLQAFSQLKMQADSSGNSLSFRQQVAQEAEDFTAQDWIDLLRIDPDAADEPEVRSILSTTALGAMVQDRDVEGRRAVASELAGAPAELQTLATSPVVGVTIDALVKSNTLPATHAVAAGRVLYFLCVAKILPSQTSATLVKLGLEAQSAETVAEKLNGLLPPTESSSPTLERIEPPAVPAATPVRAVSSAASRNIIDLRKQQPAI